MSNTIPCGQCVHFDQQYKMITGVKKEVNYGWCKRKSEYPAEPWEGAVFDVDVKRVEEGATRSKPYIVYPKKVEVSCLDVMKSTKIVNKKAKK